ncbi:MAG: SDR family NAD(P)-dependent oxidoreductase [Candidatus Bathyarchaeia archaeon]
MQTLSDIRNERFVKKVAMVTGSGSGIGKAILLRLAREGAITVVNDVDSEKVRRVLEEIKALGSEAIGIRADATKRGDVINAVRSALDQFGKIDVLVNNVGLFDSGIPFVEMDEKDWRFCMDINLTSTFYYCKEVVPSMIEKKYGQIVNLSSRSGKVGSANFTHYCAAKHAVIGFTRALAMELVGYNIRVNAVCPGAIDTEMHQRALLVESSVEKITEDEARRRRVATIPMRRFGTPEDVAGLIGYLASDDSKFITGQSFNITGGEEFH